MEKFLKKLYQPPKNSHKGQNGKLLVIGGSKLFHAASLWALEVASRIVDLVHYCSVPENNQIVQKAKEKFRNGIVVSRSQVEDYIQEDDCILIGPGMTRDEETRVLTSYLLRQYPQKKWVIDAGALQMITPSLIPPGAILTPHQQEFIRLFKVKLPKAKKRAELTFLAKLAAEFSQQYQCTILLKGPIDFIACQGKLKKITGGNAGMTKGGTGDVLAGLVAAFYCKNEACLSAIAASFFNKKACDSLFQKVGYYFNASDLVAELPLVMKRVLLPETEE